MQSTTTRLAVGVAAGGLIAVLLPAVAIAVPTPARPSDFNGDGWADLAVGVPNEDVGTAATGVDCGAVNVLYGSSKGLSATADELWSQGSPGVLGVCQADEGFGSSLASGDFDADGHADLAIGTPSDAGGLGGDGSLDRAGAINILYGSDAGLTADGDQVFNPRTVPELVQVDDAFGQALASADFDGDGYWDLAVGAPWGRELGTGRVTILPGSAAGLDVDGAITLTESMLPDDPGNGDGFGWHIAAGDLNGDRRPDLVVGGIDIQEGGQVGVFFGSDTGLAQAGSQRWSQDSPGILDQAEEYDFFGSALAIADFDHDGYGDLAIGSSSETVGAVWAAGIVNVLYGSAAGVTAERNQLWGENSSGVSGIAEPNDDLGRSLAAADFDGDGYADLAIGVAMESFAGHPYAGSLLVLRGGPVGLSASGARRWSQDSPGVPGTNESKDGFGATLAAGNFGRGGRADLVIGVPGESINGQRKAGMVVLLFGRESGLEATGAQSWYQDSPGVFGHCGRYDTFGSALTP